MGLYRSYIGVIWGLYGDNGEGNGKYSSRFGVKQVWCFFKDYTGTFWVWSLGLGYRTTLDWGCAVQGIVEKWKREWKMKWKLLNIGTLALYMIQDYVP